MLCVCVLLWLFYDVVGKWVFDPKNPYILLLLFSFIIEIHNYHSILKNLTNYIFYYYYEFSFHPFCSLNVLNIAVDFIFPGIKWKLQSDYLSCYMQPQVFFAGILQNLFDEMNAISFQMEKQRKVSIYLFFYFFEFANWIHLKFQFLSFFSFSFSILSLNFQFFNFLFNFRFIFFFFFHIFECQTNECIFYTVYCNKTNEKWIVLRNDIVSYSLISLFCTI